MLVTITPLDDHRVAVDGVIDSPEDGEFYIDDGLFAEVRIGPTPTKYGDQPVGGGVTIEFHYTTVVGAMSYGWSAIVKRLCPGVPLLRAVVTDRDVQMVKVPGTTFQIDVNVPVATPVTYCKRVMGLDAKRGEVRTSVGRALVLES